MENQQLRVWPGRPYPLGSTWDGKGTNFALFSENATSVELWLFDREGHKTAQITIPERSNQIWHAYLPDIGPGQSYGYKVHGEFLPEEGHRFNPNKLLIDPYAKAVAGDVKWDDSLFAYPLGDDKEDLSPDETDSSPFLPKSIVIDPSFDWQGDTRPDIPLNQTIIYELHVKGFTKLHPDLPEHQKGTYAGLSHPSVISYFKDLGITSVELLPVHQFVSDRHLEEEGLSNFWGYNTIGFFAPHSEYSSSGLEGNQVNEFKTMVRELHKAGIEVILDVVYNHTAEGNHLGPTLSFKGIDNKSYYRSVPENQRYYMDYTGTGNTMNMMHPSSLQIVMDSLRYWITEMHVDGFRFDLASALARELHEVDRLGAFFDIIHQDPVISQVKLIAEPWDVGEGGYQVGNFPPGWTEWNGKYRDCIRDFWRGECNSIGEFATRFIGSPDLYENDRRHPTASINFITAHDGFTMNDLVSYEEKHNEANKEDNNDGADDNRSWNCGEEGPSDDQDVISLRNRQKRNFLTTLFLSQGVPMLVAGDEFGRTQFGNNNAYCQDNELSWFDWELANKNKDILSFTTGLIRFSQTHELFKLESILKTSHQTRGAHIVWHGVKIGAPDLTETSHTIAFTLHHPKKNELIHVMINAFHEKLYFDLPLLRINNHWHRIVDTSLPSPEDYKDPEDAVRINANSYLLEPFSTVVLTAI